jgi:hypothetical protein
VELQPQRAAQTDVVGTFVAGAQERFVAVDLLLVNRGAEPIAMTLSSFSVRRDAEAAIGADLATAGHPLGCGKDDAAEAGGTKRCTLVFRTPAELEPNTIVYKAASGLEYTAPLELLPCESCGQRCTDVQWDPDNCGACGKKAGLGTCNEGTITCKAEATDCSGTCVDLKTDPAHCGACNKPTSASAICEDGKLTTCMAPTTMNCGNKCIDPYWDGENCGKCGRTCEKGACSNGLCCENAETKERVNCATVCGDRGCETVGATYQGCGKIVWIGVGTCNDVPLATEMTDDCEVTFHELDCSCCE